MHRLNYLSPITQLIAIKVEAGFAFTTGEYGDGGELFGTKGESDQEAEETPIYY